MKKLFNPKTAIVFQPSDRINLKLIILLIILILVISSTNVLILLSNYGQTANNEIIKTIRETLSSLTNLEGAQKISVIITLIRDTLFILLFSFLAYTIISVIMLVAANWLLKKILGLFKREISFYKLLNISVYTIFCNRFLLLICNLIFLPLFFLFKITADNFAISVLLTIILAAINILTLILYIYGVKISVSKIPPSPKMS